MVKGDTIIENKLNNSETVELGQIHKNFHIFA